MAWVSLVFAFEGLSSKGENYSIIVNSSSPFLGPVDLALMFGV